MSLNQNSLLLVDLDRLEWLFLLAAHDGIIR